MRSECEHCVRRARSCASLPCTASGVALRRPPRPLGAGAFAATTRTRSSSSGTRCRERKAVSNDEAFHALLLFVDGEDAAADYDGRVRALKDRRMLPGGFDGAADAPVRRGTLAVALARALDDRAAG